MVRYVVGLFIFAVALCAYIVNTQHGGIFPRQAPVADTPSPDPSPTPATTTPAADIVDAIAPRDLGFETVSVPVGHAVRDTLAVLGLDVAGLPPSPADQRFARSVGEALKTGTSDTDIIAMIDRAADTGEIAIPAGIVQANGQIDTATYLRAVLTTAVLVTEDATPVALDLSNDPTAIITADGYDYVVTDTDSLAAIAIKFYGDVMQTTRIITANPIALAQPDQIAAGETLKIPTF